MKLTMQDVGKALKKTLTHGVDTQLWGIVKGIETDEDGVTLHWGGSPYFISWGRLSTHEQLLAWIWHLCEKEWFTLKHMLAFMVVVSDRSPNIKIRRHVM